jgi:hypothetical protein
VSDNRAARKSKFKEFFMKTIGFWGAVQIGVLILSASIGGIAQTPREMNLRGTISDYSPQSVSGPWELRGLWSLKVKGDSGTADFSAALTMVRSDLGVMLSGGGDLNSAKQRNAHTHHITLVDGTITPLTNGFRVTGNATITANGAFPPPFGPNSTVQIDITGSNTVTFSNIQLTMGGNAAVHFGTNPFTGVVRNAADHDNDRD